MDELKEQNAPMGDEIPAGVNETSRRIANLLFLFGSTRRPIPTEEIILDSDLGYGSGNPESDKRKFRRDRNTLAERGCFIVQAEAEVSAENESACWILDRKRTYADLPPLALDDLITLVHAIDVQLAGSSAPYRQTLRRVREKLAQAALGGHAEHTGNMGRPPHGEGSEQDAAWAALWSAFAARRTARFAYCNAHGENREREVEQYGFFELNGTPYMVGRDCGRDAVRTFNLQRVNRVRAPKGRYEIPGDFDVRSFIDHPFGFGSGSRTEASFLIPGATAATERRRITLGKGQLEAIGGTGDFRWTVGVRNTEAAARFAIERGIYPLAPDALVERWEAMLDKAVARHA